jgi:RNA polymerase sigma-70 factor, ECF subfamily
MSDFAITAGSCRFEGGQPGTREARFNALVSNEARFLYRYAYWLTGNRATAEDVVQETFLRAWRYFDQLADSAAARSWLLTILRRENARRFERKRAPEVDIPVDAVADPVCHYDTSTDAYVLRQALNRLSRKYREPLLLQVIYGYSQKEVARHLGISTSGAGARLFRARQKLRELLDEPDPGDRPSQ